MSLHQGAPTKEFSMKFEEEIARKDRLMNLFIQLEDSERERMRRKSAKKYEKMFRGEAEVKTINASSVRLIRANGKKINSLEVTPEIASLLRKDDILGLTAGLSQGMWRLISLEFIGSRIPQEMCSSAEMCSLDESAPPPQMITH
jgi:hypothetical protein